MVWILAAVAVLVLFFVFINRTARLARSLSCAAQNARNRKDWPAASKLYRHGYEVAGLLKEPLKSQMESVIEIQWASVLYRQGQMTEAEDLVRRGLVKGRRCFPVESGLLLEGGLTWGDLCTDQGRHCEAEQHYRKVLEGDERRGNLGGAIFDLQKLADSLIRQGRRGEAEAEIHRAIVLETQVVHEQLLRSGKNPAAHSVVSMCQPDLVFCREQYGDARRLYREKVAYWERQVTRPGQIDVGRLEMRLALAEAETGHLADAIEMYTRAEATFRREWCEEHPKAVAAREARAALARQNAETVETGNASLLR
jgi:tetratricopeptide (TPR) repeat protein